MQYLLIVLLWFLIRVGIEKARERIREEAIKQAIVPPARLLLDIQQESRTNNSVESWHRRNLNDRLFTLVSKYNSTTLYNFIHGIALNMSCVRTLKKKDSEEIDVIVTGVTDTTSSETDSCARGVWHANTTCYFTNIPVASCT